MAKDPAFLYYDGDAAKDMAHMNRLERGAYIDLIHAQKKFGRMSIEIIKKILGKDFESCWISIEVVLTIVEGKYFIEWLENSIARRENFSESRRRNRQKKSQKETSEEEVNKTCEDIFKISDTSVKDMEIENEIENINVKGKEDDGLEEGDNPYLIPAMLQSWKKYKPAYPDEKINDFPALMWLSEFICKQAGTPFNPRDGDCMSLILTEWEKWAVFVSNDNFYSDFSLSSIKKNSQTIFQKMLNGTTKRQAYQQSQQPRGTFINGNKDYGKL